MIPIKRHTIDCFNLFEQIEGMSGRNDKKNALACANEYQKRLLVLAFDPFIQFHISKWDKKFGFPDKELDDIIVVSEFYQLTEECKNSNRTSILVDKVSKFFAKLSERQNKWLSRVLVKDMRIGINVKSILDVFPNLFPTFEVQLAFKLEKDFSNLDFSRDKIIERKYDGFRFAVFSNYSNIPINVVSTVTRSGKEIPNENFNNRLLVELQGFYGVLDGEGYSHSITFEELSGVLRSENKPLPEDIQYCIFDVLTLEEWEQRKTPPLRERLLRRGLVKSGRSEFLKAVPFIEVPGSLPKEEQIKIINKFYGESLELGFEGSMVKYLDAPYRWGRGGEMLKIKPEETVDAVIVDYYPGNGKYFDMLGGFIVEDENGQAVRIGGGYKDSQRTEFFINPKQSIGQWIEFKYTERTADGSYRHPRFKRFRDSKG